MLRASLVLFLMGLGCADSGPLGMDRAGGGEPLWNGGPGDEADVGQKAFGSSECDGGVAAPGIELGPLDDPFAPWEEGDDIEVLFGSEGGSSISLAIRARGTPADLLIAATVSTDDDGASIATLEPTEVTFFCGEDSRYRATLSIPVTTEKAEFQLIAAPATVQVDVSFEGQALVVTHQGTLVL